MDNRLTPAQATTAIIALINSRPHSPFAGEIQAIVERVAAAPEPEGSSLLAVKLRCLMPALRVAIDRDNDAFPGTPECRKAKARFDELNALYLPLCQQICATPPATLDDLVIRAEIAQFEARD